MTSRGTFVHRFIPVIALTIVLWVVEIVNLLTDHGLNRHGLIPRTTSGLYGIAWAPFLHGSIAHLAANTPPLLVLGGLVASAGAARFLLVSLFVTALGGAGVWLIGREAIHVGASGLVFGYFGFLLTRAWFTRTLRALLAATLTVMLYAGLVWGVLPQERLISWEAHLCGLLSGVLAARLLPPETPSGPAQGPRRSNTP